MTYGATPEDWTTFDLLHGLTADLLPVVSNPNAVISPNSKMKGLGKTPSLYNRQRQVAGMINWTSKQSTGAEIERWMSEPDYGICIQTRAVRALDIDVEDAEKAIDIERYIRRFLVHPLPKRYRNNSGKCLLAFRLAGEHAKRVIKVDGGIIEFLANGQQFIAAGTHSSGARYKWDNWQDSFPELSVDEFEALWAGLVEEFAVEAPSEGKLRKRGEAIAGVVDSVVDKLDVLEWGKDGQAFITCPFKDGHSMDSGVTETAYFPAGTGGYEQGHFKCLHASCQGRSDEEFLSALGMGVENDFEVIVAEAGEVAEVPAPKLLYDKHGTIKRTLPNIVAMLECSARYGWQVRRDTFYGRVMISPYGVDEWRPFDDADSIMLRKFFESCCRTESLSRELMNDAVTLAARENSFDTAQHWLNSLVWDGVPRIETFFPRYFKVEDSAYSRAASSYIWTALAGRVLQPGVQADMVPVLVGGQGVGKTTGIKAMVPDEEFYVEVNLAERDADLSRLMRGKLVGEISELRNFNKLEKEAIKAFITRTTEEWVEKYDRYTTAMPRRLAFIATTNQQEFLDDDTGNRRWLPMTVGKVDVEAIRRDCLQLWAEAAVVFSVMGVEWQAERLAGDAHERHRVHDVWFEAVQRYLNTPDNEDGSTPATRKNLRVSEILQHALNFDLRHVKRSDEMRVGNILRELGYERKTLRLEGKICKVWG